MTTNLPTSWSSSFQPNWYDMYRILEATRALSNVVTYNAQGTISLSTGTGTQNTLAGPSVPFVKRRGKTDSDVMVLLMMTSFIGAGTSPVVTWGIGAGTAAGTNKDTDVCSWAGTTGHHDPQLAVQRITGLDAGLYNMNLYYRMSGTASPNINLNNGDSVTMIFQELPL